MVRVPDRPGLLDARALAAPEAVALIGGADEVQVVMDGLRQAEQYAALGVHRLVTFPNPKDISVEETVTNARGAVDAAGVVATGGPP